MCIHFLYMKKKYTPFAHNPLDEFVVECKERCCCCIHIKTRIIKSVAPGQAPVTLELRNTLGKNTNKPRWYMHISQLTQFIPPPETYKREIGSQSTMGQVHTGPYVSLLTPGETDNTNNTACRRRKATTYIYIYYM